MWYNASMNSKSIYGAYFGFFWNTDEADRKEAYAKADALIGAAIKGGMKKEDAVAAVEHLFSQGHQDGVCDESFNSAEH